MNTQLSTTQPQTAISDVATKTENQKFNFMGIGYVTTFLGKSIKSILCENAFLSIFDTEDRELIKKDSSASCITLTTPCSVVGATVCTLSGCYLDCTYSSIAAQTLLGCCAGCHVGNTYKNYLINEIKKQDDALQNNNIASANTNETIVNQPITNTIISEGPPSYESIFGVRDRKHTQE